MDAERKKELHAMLLEVRRGVAGEVKDRMKANCDEKEQRRGDKMRFAENSEVRMREDIELALIQMKFDTLSKIDQALGRLDQGTYGYCFDCSEEIAEGRLRALPFAVLCRDCQEAKEVAKQRKQTRRREVAFGLFAQDDL